MKAKQLSFPMSEELPSETFLLLPIEWARTVVETFYQQVPFKPSSKLFFAKWLALTQKLINAEYFG